MILKDLVKEIFIHLSAFCCCLLIAACGSGSNHAGKGPEISLDNDTTGQDSTLDSGADEGSDFPFPFAVKQFIGKGSEGIYPAFGDGNDPVLNKLNRLVDSLAGVLVGEPIANLTSNDSVKDSLFMLLHGESFLKFQMPTAVHGVISLWMEARYQGRKTPARGAALNFDTESGQAIYLDQLYAEGYGAEDIRQVIFSEVAAHDLASRYDCKLDTNWNEIRDFLFHENGLLWVITEKAVPDRKFCKEIMELIIPWAKLSPVLDQSHPVLKRMK